MAVAVGKGFISSTLENPMDTIAPVATLAFPVLAGLGGMQLALSGFQN
jgi:hypothetical protein